MQAKLEYFLRKLKLNVSPTTFRRKKYQIKSFYKYLLYSNIDYLEVKKNTVEKYLLSLKCCISVKKQLCCVIGEFYDFMEVDNPVKDIVFKKDNTFKVPKVPSQQVIYQIINTLDIENTLLSLRNRLILEFAYGSGLRLSELVKLDIDDLDLEGKTVYVNGKGGKNRIVPLTGAAVSAIREYLTERKAWAGPVFVSFKGRRLCNSSIYQILKNKYGIRPHSLRHACAGHMLKNGCGIKVIQELLGHESLSTTQVYTHINKNDLKEVVDMKHPRNI